MGDVNGEPSMEDILSSIKRIIAEESDTGPSRGRRSDRLVPRRDQTESSVRDDVLELREAVKAALPSSVPPATAETTTPPADTDVAPETVRPAPAVTPPEPEASGILSDRAAEATRGPLDTLSRLVVRPEVPGSDTLESMVREMLRPMLREWLDSHLPQLVETMVAKEIDRITGK